MSIPLTINGAVFEYPVDFDENWGVDATGWAQAVTNGMLQMAGGSFPLTADVNFGPNFGLLSKYFETRSSNPATTGTVRLSSADAGIAFRNNANSGNLILTTNASDQLLYNGSVVTTGAGSVLSITGTANQVIASSPTGAVTLSLPQNIALASSPTFAALTLTATSTQLILGTGNQISISAPTPAAARAYTIPDTGTSTANFVMTEGAQTINGVKTLGTPLAVNSGGTGDSTLTAYTLLAGGTTSTGAVQSLSAGTAGQLLASNGAAALPTFTTAFTVGAAGPNGIIVGTNTNDNPSAGNVGQHISSFTQTGFPTTSVWGDATSISLTAGDWDVTVYHNIGANASTVTQSYMGVSSVAGDNQPAGGKGDDFMQTSLPSGANSENNGFASITKRFSLASTTTIYYKYMAVFTAATPSAFGTIRARRAR